MPHTDIDSTSNNTVSITEAEPGHLHSMAQCHIMAFPGRFMTEMGFRWLCALYRFFINHHEGICQVAVEGGGKVVGFAVGGEPDVREQFLRGAMLRYPHIIFWKFLTKGMVRSALLAELFRKLGLKRSDASSEEVKPQEGGGACGNLLSICVLPDRRGTGIANRLIESFQNACIARKYERLELYVVSENTRAIAFYKKHGWRDSGRSGDSIKFVLDL